MQTNDQSRRQKAEACRTLSAMEVASVSGGVVMIPTALLYPIYIAGNRRTQK